MKRWVKIALGSVVALLIAGAAAKDYVLLHLPGWLAPRVRPFREIAWRPGPATPAKPPAQRPPNIVLIVADDLGFNDISFNGGGVAHGMLQTPNVDALGREGATFAEGYAGNATCAPSRAALMTGRYPTRFGFEFTPTDTRFAQTVAGFPGEWSHRTILDQTAVDNDPPADSKGVPASERTIAELLRSGGYHTIHLGKWHLGGSPGMRPEDQGFVAATGYRTIAERAPPVTPQTPPDMRQPGSAVFATPDDGDPRWWRWRAGAQWRRPEGREGRAPAAAEPVVQIAYDDALAYARWRGVALPSEAQWERAARLGGVDPEHTPPGEPAVANTWQGPFPARDLGADGYAGRAPVGCFHADRAGLYDMIGNVWEWTRDAADARGDRGVIKGGSYLCAASYCARYRPAARQFEERGLGADHLGLRVIDPRRPPPRRGASI